MNFLTFQEVHFLQLLLQEDLHHVLLVRLPFHTKKSIHFRNINFWLDFWDFVFILNYLFDCCKQSLTRLHHPSMHPSIHPSINLDEQFTVNICSYFMQVGLNENAQNFRHLTLRRKCSQFTIIIFGPIFKTLLDISIGIFILTLPIFNSIYTSNVVLMR